MFRGTVIFFCVPFDTRHGGLTSRHFTGFGHCSRTALLIEAFLTCGVDPATVHVVTDTIKEPFDNIIAKGVHYRRAATDAGVSQPLAYTVDAIATLRQLSEFMRSFPGKLADEVAWLRQNQITAVLSDASFLPWHLLHFS